MDAYDVRPAADATLTVVWHHAGAGGLVDDDVAFVTPWGVDLTAVEAPVLLVHGADDRMVPATHVDRLAAAVPGGERWRRPGHGHVSVLSGLPEVLDRLLVHR